MPDILVTGSTGVKYGSISKRYSLLYYLVSVYCSKRSFFVMYTCRRAIETYLYTKDTTSRINVFYLGHKVVFYYVLSNFFTSQLKYAKYLFYLFYGLLNILQGYFNYRLYVKKDRRYNNVHYATEVMFYMLYFMYFRGWFTINLLVYVSLYVLITLKQQGEEKNIKNIKFT